MTTEQQTLLADRYPEIFAAIKAANIGIRASVDMQVDTTLLGNIARLWQMETKRTVGFAWDTHYECHLKFTYESVNVCLYSLIPKQQQR
jgi:hypothetical protein